MPFRLRAGWSLATAALLFAAVLAARAQVLDTGLNAAANAEVFALAYQPDGKLVAGGKFTLLGERSRGGLGRFNADGSLDAGFAPAANGIVRTLCVQPDGRILVGGEFTAIDGLTRQRIARLNVDGSVDATFTASANGVVRGFAVQADGRIVVVGSFSQLGSAARPGVGRLNLDGSVDLSFAPTLAGSVDAQSRTVGAVAIDATGRILIGGNFATVNGLSMPALARFDQRGFLDSAFHPAPNGPVAALALQPDGRIAIAGQFSLAGGGTTRALARLLADGTLDPNAPTPPNGPVLQLLVQPDGKILLAGTFTGVGSGGLPYFARLNADASFDFTFLPRIEGSLGASVPGVYAVAAFADGQIAIGGAFSSVQAAPRLGVARFGTPLPTLLQQPRDVVATAGAAVTLSVMATGDRLLYQWRRDGIDLVGATASTLQLADVQARDAGVYTVAVGSARGTVVSRAARLSLGSPPVPSYTVTTLAGVPGQTGRSIGPGDHARFDRPLGLAISRDGTLFVVDVPNNLVRELARYGEGSASILAGVAGWGIACDASGFLYVADADARIRRVTRDGIVTTFAGSGTRGTADGAPTVAQFRMPRGVAVDAAGTVYVADSDNFTIRKLTPTGVVSTLAGEPGTQGLVDGTGRAARFNGPWALAVDAAGSLYVADRATVRKVTPAGAVTTLAPSGSLGDVIGVAVDGAGNVFVADAAGHTIRRILPNGQIGVIAGAIGQAGSADGAGTAARFNQPYNLVADEAGALYIADRGNSTIRKATPDATPLAILAQPAAQHVAAGRPVALSVAGMGTGLTYQWKKDGAAIAGATQASYALAEATAARMGLYTVVVSSEGSALESAPAILTVETPGQSGRLVNVSTRGYVPAGGALMPGFVLRGSDSATKSLLVRGVGPALKRFAVTDALDDPRLDLIPSGAATPLASNDDWATGSAAGIALLAELTTQVGAFPLDVGAKDAAAAVSVSPAVSRAYSVRIAAGDAAAAGVVLAEVYDADPASTPLQLANLSTRGYAGKGSDALVPGFVIAGPGPLRVLVRAVGPGLAPFGVENTLADPQIALLPLGKSTVLAGNDNWGGERTLSDAFSAAGAFSLRADSRDAAVVLWLPPGGYSVVVSGVDGGAGNALVEVYDVR